MLGFEARGNLEYPEKTSWSKRETLQQTQTTCTTQRRCRDSGTQPHWWESRDRWRSPLVCEDRDSLSLRWMPDYSLETWQLSNGNFVWLQCKLEFRGILGCSFCFQRDINKIKSLDCCKGLLNSLTINIKHFFVQSWRFNFKLFEKMPGFIDLCRHRSHPSPYYASQLNAMQLQRDDLAPWGGWKHSCNLWWWQATVISSFNALGIQVHTERYNSHQEREQNRFCTKKPKLSLFIF